MSLNDVKQLIHNVDVTVLKEEDKFILFKMLLDEKVREQEEQRLSTEIGAIVDKAIADMEKGYNVA